MDIVISALKQLSVSQYDVFRENLIALIEMDSRIDLLEWSLRKILFNHLDGQFRKLAHSKPRYSHAVHLTEEVALLLSVMAYAGHQDQHDVEAAFLSAKNTLEFSGLELVAKKDIRLSSLDRSLQKLEKLKPLAKPQLLKACAASIVHDKKVSPVEIELLRAFSDVLDCPMPPIVP